MTSGKYLEMYIQICVGNMDIVNDHAWWTCKKNSEYIGFRYIRHK